MAKAGLNPTDASFVGVGGGPSAIAAMESGELDAIANLDPIITKLQQDGAIRLVADTRFPRVNYQIFGGTNPAAVLYAKQDWCPRKTGSLPPGNRLEDNTSVLPSHRDIVCPRLL